jgi:hypothetical protein
MRCRYVMQRAVIIMIDGCFTARWSPTQCGGSSVSSCLAWNTFASESGKRENKIDAKPIIRAEVRTPTRPRHMKELEGGGATGSDRSVVEWLESWDIAEDAWIIM